MTTNTPIALARHAIAPVLAGSPPNGTKPEDCGEWAPVVKSVFDGHAAAGTPGAIRAWQVLVNANPKIARVLSEDGIGDAWGPILPFHSADLPPFPLDVLPDWLREYCEAITETMQTPADLAGMLALSVLAAACGGRVEVRVKPGYEEPVNIFTVTGLPPGTGKSPVFRAMTAPILYFERQQIEKSEKDIADTEMRRDVLEQRIRDAKSKTSKLHGREALESAYSEIDGMNGDLRDLVPPVRPKYLVDDATPESVASILADQGGRLAVLSAEGDIFAIMAGRYSSGAPNIGVYKKGHNGDELRVDRKSRSEIIRRPALTMGITTQPEVMRSFGQNNIFRSEGLLARFLYALPKSTVGSRKVDTEPVPDSLRSLYTHCLLNILENMHSENTGNSGISAAPSRDSGNSVKNPLIDDSNYIIYIEISKTGKTLFLDFKGWIEPQLGPYGAFAAIADWANKLSGAVLRIAGLLHMADYAAYNSHYSQNEISEATIARAIRFAQYLIPHAQAAYAEIGADPAVESARLVLRWIEKTAPRTFSKRDCYQGVKGTLKRADDLDPVLSLLCDHGYIREQETIERAGPGRKPSPNYDVNPMVVSSAHNSHYAQNTPSASYEPPTPVADEPHGYRSIGGYDE